MKVISEHLTQRFIAQYKLPDGVNQVVFRDTNPDVKGVHLRISRRKRLWYLRRQVNGHTRTNWELGLWPTMSVSDAIRAAESLHDDLQEGNTPVEEEAPRKIQVETVGEALDLYLAVKKHAITERTAGEYRADIERLGWSNRRLAAISEHQVQSKMDEFVIARHVATGMDSLQMLQRLFIYLGKKGVVKTNPVAHMSVDELWPGHVPNRPVFKEPEHWRDAMIIASEWGTPEVSDHYQFCAFTGLRPWSEVARIKWKHIDLRNKVFMIPGDNLKLKGAKREKANRPPNLILPITDPLLAIIQRRDQNRRPNLSERQRQFVFASKMGNSKTGHMSSSSNSVMMNAIRDHLGYGVCTYSLRRFFIQRMRKVGVDPQVRFFLTDQSPAALAGIQATYDRIEFDDDIRVEAERMADDLNKLLLAT